MFRAGILNQQTQRTAPPISISVVASSENVVNAAGASITVNKPAGTQAGDHVFFFLQTRNSLIASGPVGATKLTEYGVEATTISTGSLTNERFAIWALIAGVSEPATYTVGLTDGGTDGITLIAVTYRGVSSYAIGGFTANVVVTGPTAAIGDYVLSWMGSSYTVSTSWGPPAGFTTHESNYDVSSDVGGHLAYKEIISAGAVGSIDWSKALDYSLGCYLHLIAETV